MGRNSVEFLVLTSAVRTKPSLPGNTFVTWPSNQWAWRAFSIASRTRPLTAWLRRLRIHFLRSCSRGRHSRSHLAQKWFERIWPLCHSLREYRSLSWKSPSGKDIPCRCWKGWMGVIGSQSLGSLLLGHKSRPLVIPTASPKTVLRVSRVTKAQGGPEMAFMVPRTLLMSRSQTQEMCLAAKGWKCHFVKGWQCHSTSLSCTDISMISWSRSWMASLISFSLPLKLVPLSLQTSLTAPRMLIKTAGLGWRRLTTKIQHLQCG